MTEKAWAAMTTVNPAFLRVPTTVSWWRNVGPSAALARHSAPRDAGRAGVLRPLARAPRVSRLQIRMVRKVAGRAPDLGREIHSFIVIPSAIAEISMVVYLLVILR